MDYLARRTRFMEKSPQQLLEQVQAIACATIGCGERPTDFLSSVRLMDSTCPLAAVASLYTIRSEIQSD